mmetsp:Transcript_23257/g.34457  ORF Transcript_23257/g.34457 Transcript_23257/m.34457 type:complete len:218 (-) Transcript_23257:96-749(-)
MEEVPELMSHVLFDTAYSCNCDQLIVGFRPENLSTLHALCGEQMTSRASCRPSNSDFGTKSCVGQCFTKTSPHGMDDAAKATDSFRRARHYTNCVEKPKAFVRIEKGTKCREGRSMSSFQYAVLASNQSVPQNPTHAIEHAISRSNQPRAAFAGHPFSQDGFESVLAGSNKVEKPKARTKTNRMTEFIPNPGSYVIGVCATQACSRLRSISFSRRPV